MEIVVLPRKKLYPRKRVKKPKKARTTQKSILRLWGLPEKVQASNLRWKHPIEKGIYWWFFSRFIRERDVKKYGTCISCNRPITVDTSDCGHFIPAASCGRDLLFDEINNNAECSHCNAWDELHLIGYAKGLDKRYGQGTAERLLQRYYDYKYGPTVKDWKKADYEEKIRLICGTK